MNKLTLMAFLAVIAVGSAANADCGYSAPAPTCGATCPCPMECPCQPTCCPANRGLFDGGTCCGGLAVPPLCGC